MDIQTIRDDFPIFQRKINGKDIIYFDNGATSQKPQSVIDSISEFYSNYNANVMRGVHKLGEEATNALESSREKIADFINADSEEILFTKNATESINLVLYSWALNNLKKDDKILISVSEHHANLVTWQQAAKKTGAKLEFVEIDDEGRLVDFESKIKNTKLFAITHVSNVTGVINDVRNLCKIANDEGAITVIDGAQSIPHMKVDVGDINCHFFAFTGHKMLGPTGVGVLYCNEKIYSEMSPFNFGGEMISEVKRFESKWNTPPHKFEAGTPNIAGIIGLGAAVDYLKKVGMNKIQNHENEITKYAMEKMGELEGVELFGPKEYSEDKAGLVSFKIKGTHPHDVAALLNDLENIMVRSGYHCAEPLHNNFGEEPTARASFYLYNTNDEVDVFIETLKKVKQILQV